MANHISDVFAFGLSLLVRILVVSGHGGMVEPPMRSVMWRYGFDTPVNYDWNALYCGGRQNFIEQEGKCGFCGDPVQGPYENDKGGVYDTGIIVRHYPAGLKEIEVKVEITAYHKGYFEFKLCANNDGPITQKCFSRYPLPIKEGLAQGNPLKYYPPETPSLHELHVALPPDVICDRCVLQWTYTVGNSFETGKDGRSCVGCGYQETFVNCADISIGGTKDRIPVQQLPIQDGGVVEISNRPEVIAVLDNAKPDTSIGDILRELNVKEQNPGQNKPVIKHHSVDLPPRKHVDSKPKVVKPVTTTSVGNPAKPNLASNEGIKKPVRRLIPPPMPGRATEQIPGFPSLQGLDITNSLQNDFHPRPHHNMLLDSPAISGPYDPVADVIMRSRQQEMNSKAFTRRLIEPPVPKISRNYQPSHSVSRGQESSLGRPLPLVDSIYAMRDRIPNPNVGESVPTVDIYGRIQGLTPFADPAQYDQNLEGRQLHDHYMAELERMRQLGHNMHNSLSNYDNQYRNSLSGEGFSQIDNYLPYIARERQIVEPAYEAPAPRHTLPRRIIVHSMDLAQRLVRTYPQLRGRVFLSRVAHLENKYAHTMHKYARRQSHA